MNIPEYISESLETIFGLKILLLCGSGSGIKNLFTQELRTGKIRIRDAAIFGQYIYNSAEYRS